MEFIDFVRLHGLIVEKIIPGRVVRCSTEDKPEHRNGAYFFSDTISWIQNWSKHNSPVFWTSDGSPAPQEEYKKHLEDHKIKKEKLADEAAVRARDILDTSFYGESRYLHSKGVRPATGILDRDHRLIIPIADVCTTELLGLQIISTLENERKELTTSKKFMYGMRAENGVHNLRGHGSRRILCEGYATGRTIEMALDKMGVDNFGVTICFSAFNIISVARNMDKESVFIYADNDAAGLASAKKSGLLYIHSDTGGNDANDDMLEFGIDYLANKIQRCLR